MPARTPGGQGDPPEGVFLRLWEGTVALGQLHTGGDLAGLGAQRVSQSVSLSFLLQDFKSSTAYVVEAHDST